ncbi:hypothetical protein N5D61_02715 [Pseudomonas sp. GD03842]|uniref:hypothetical protein n=1 Tax=Pseudomonas sp. GD03842 TaxID=2975385 RepID=UPI00244A1BBA|nr:hypothetical protein [Pseudomonas sp. GD03842]MDH0745255.1 hypothetical protein [Pseudomonas sp. GD03842]
MNFVPLPDPRKQIIEDLRVQIDHFLSTGKKIQPLESFPEKAPPAKRSKFIDPDYVLSRKRRRLSVTERNKLRRITEAI